MRIEKKKTEHGNRTNNKKNKNKNDRADWELMKLRAAMIDDGDAWLHEDSGDSDNGGKWDDDSEEDASEMMVFNEDDVVETEDDYGDDCEGCWWSLWLCLLFIVLKSWEFCGVAWGMEEMNDWE